METPTFCPQCGQAVEAGATFCASCGQAIGEPGTEPVPPAQPDSKPAPPASQSHRPPAPVGPSPFSLGEIQARWAVSNPNLLLLMLVLLAGAIAVGTFGHISSLVADEDEFLKKLHLGFWQDAAQVLALAGAAVAVLIRVSSGSREETKSEADLAVLYILVGATAAFTIVVLVTGMSDRLDAALSWAAYSIVFASITIAWSAVAKPLPPVIQSGLSSEMIGWILLAIAGVTGVVGLALGQGDDVLNDSGDGLGGDFLAGLSWLHASFVAVLLAFAWFLGLQGQRGREGTP